MLAVAALAPGWAEDSAAPSPLPTYLPPGSGPVPTPLPRMLRALAWWNRHSEAGVGGQGPSPRPCGSPFVGQPAHLGGRPIALPLAEPYTAVQGICAEPELGAIPAGVEFPSENLLRFQQVRSQKPYLRHSPVPTLAGPWTSWLSAAEGRGQRGTRLSLGHPAGPRWGGFLITPELCLLVPQPHCEVCTSQSET